MVAVCQVALRIRPLKNEEMSRGYESVATKVDSKMVLLASTKAKKVDHLRERRNNERQYVDKLSNMIRILSTVISTHAVCQVRV